MIDIVLLFGKLVFLALLYLFLFAVVRAGLRTATPAEQRPEARAHMHKTALGLLVREGPPEIRGVTVPLEGSLVIGRSPEADLVIQDSFVSSRHAVVAMDREGPFVEDLGSTNGTVVRGHKITAPTRIEPGDEVVIGDVVLTLERS